MKNSQTTIHMGWIIAVLLSLLIGSLSVSWSSLPEIPNIVSIALGLASLVLALIAIVQALTGSSTLLSSLTKIEVATQQAVSATSSVDRSAQALFEKIAILDDLPPSLHEIGKKIDDFSSAAAQANISSSQGSIETASKSPKVNLLNRYNGGTNGTLLSLYVAVVAAESEESFDTSDIFSNPYIAGMTNGYLLALKFSGSIDADYVKGKFFITKIDSEISKQIVAAAIDDNTNFIKKYRNVVDQFFKRESSTAEPAEKTED